MAIVLSNNALAAQLPQTGIMIAASGDQVGTIGAKGTIPHPSLVSLQRRLQGKRVRLLRSAVDINSAIVCVGNTVDEAAHVTSRYGCAKALGLGARIDAPYPRGVVGAARCQVLDVRAQQHAGDVRRVGGEATHRHQTRHVRHLQHAPHVHVAGVVPRTQQTAVTSDRHRRHGDIVLRDELMGALVFAEVPDADVAAAVAGDELALVGVDDDVVDGGAVVVVALHAAGLGVPDLDAAVFGARHHPLGVAVEADPRDVVGVAFESEDRVAIVAGTLVVTLGGAGVVGVVAGAGVGACGGVGVLLGG